MGDDYHLGSKRFLQYIFLKIEIWGGGCFPVAEKKVLDHPSDPFFTIAI